MTMALVKALDLRWGDDFEKDTRRGADTDLDHGSPPWSIGAEPTPNLAICLGAEISQELAHRRRMKRGPEPGKRGVIRNEPETDGRIGALDPHGAFGEASDRGDHVVASGQRAFAPLHPEAHRELSAGSPRGLNRGDRFDGGASGLVERRHRARDRAVHELVEPGKICVSWFGARTSAVHDSHGHSDG